MNAYSLASAMPYVKLLQITDLHLFGDEQNELLGVNTTQSFQAVLDQIVISNLQFDAVLVTGDLVQDNNPKAYYRFAEMIKRLEKPVFWVEGNHDIQPQMGHCLASYPQIKPAKHCLFGEYWQCILLDSQVFGSPHGYLSQPQLDFLSTALSVYPERYSLIVLHHNLLPTNSAWLDQHSLRNLHSLEACLSPFPNVKAIMHGHIHQEVDSYWCNYRVLATPSTCIQFKPNCHQFTLDLLPQGWREIELYPNGEIKTRVGRLKTNSFLPDFDITGY